MDTSNINTYKDNKYIDLRKSSYTDEAYTTVSTEVVKLKDFKQHKNSVNNRINTIRRNLGSINKDIKDIGNDIDTLSLYEEQHKKDLNEIKENEDKIKTTICNMHEYDISTNEHTRFLLYTGIGLGVINIICNFINFFI